MTSKARTSLVGDIQDEAAIQTLLADHRLDVVANFIAFDTPDIKRIVPGFQATIPFQQGIRETIAWFEAKPERMVINDYNNKVIDDISAAYTSVFDKLNPLWP